MCLGLYSEWDWSYRAHKYTSSQNYIYNGWVLAVALEFLFWVIFY